MSESNICFNVIVLIKELNLSFADMWTYEIFEISNIYLIQLTVCNFYVYIWRKMLIKYYLFQVMSVF